ncbi:MAG: LCP family protein [Clostridia bacterium]|nr:LCP family protein [Clostridia bacterium]
MYYESYQKKRKQPPRKRKRRSFGEWLGQGLLKLVALALTVALLSAALIYALPPALFAVEPDDMNLALTDGLPATRLNVLLLGVDDLRDGAQRSDAIMIASVGYGAFKLTSVMRDTLVDIPGHDRNRLNAAYAYGGLELVMRTINQNFGLNLMHYAQVDYVALVRVIDALGGVDIDLTEAERQRLNTAMLKLKSVFAPLGYVAEEVTTYGSNVHLNGLQALSYARIRKIDSDFVRTSRQRNLLNAIVKKIKSSLWNPALLIRLMRTVMANVHTNMSALQILSLGEKALLAGDGAQLRLPVDGSYTDDGSKLTVNDFNANRSAFTRFVYEDNPAQQ